jgi:hypothetical protein
MLGVLELSGETGANIDEFRICSAMIAQMPNISKPGTVQSQIPTLKNRFSKINQFNWQLFLFLPTKIS